VSGAQPGSPAMPRLRHHSPGTAQYPQPCRIPPGTARGSVSQRPTNHGSPALTHTGLICSAQRNPHRDGW